ncbi:MAG TPA: hypothetical protein PKI19_11320, partial [Elusimicrobiales bacterium]|nr:hypothetical protein [Elusimicrobiales bacterium]
MKKIVIAVLAAFPVAVSAQAVTGTLEMVENLSVSAGSNKDLSVARVDASKAFTLTDLRPGNGPQQPYNPP